MASETRIRPRTLLREEVWPPDDTEESVLGTDFHQMTIMNLRWGVNEAARLHRTPGRPAPWQALSQTTLLGCVRPNGKAYKTLPDVFVYHQPIDRNRGSVALDIDGPPALIVEVLSESTYRADLNLERGKGYSYARAGAPEYLALDPNGAFLPEGGRAWRLEGGVYRPWERDADGRWRSDEIAVSIGLEGALATVYTHDGRRMLHEGEIEEEIGRRDEELARKDAELEELRRRLLEVESRK